MMRIHLGDKLLLLLLPVVHSMLLAFYEWTNFPFSKYRIALFCACCFRFSAFLSMHIFWFGNFYIEKYRQIIKVLSLQTGNMIKMRYCEKHAIEIKNSWYSNIESKCSFLLGSIECHRILLFKPACTFGGKISMHVKFPWFNSSSISHVFFIEKVSLRALTDWNCFINGLNRYKCI